MTEPIAPHRSDRCLRPDSTPDQATKIKAPCFHFSLSYRRCSAAEQYKTETCRREVTDLPSCRTPRRAGTSTGSAWRLLCKAVCWF